MTRPLKRILKGVPLEQPLQRWMVDLDREIDAIESERTIDFASGTDYSAILADIEKQLAMISQPSENYSVALADIEKQLAMISQHTQGTDTDLGAVGTKNPPIDADKALYRDSAASDTLVTSTWTQIKAFLKTYFDTLYVAVTGRYRYAAALADGATITLPTITANWPAHGFIHCAHASTGVISESAEFEYGSTGTVQLIRGTANIEANGATAGKISLGPAVAANPVVIKNNLGGGVSVNIIIILWYA